MKSIFWGNDSAWFWTMVQAVGVITTLVLIYRQIRIGRHASMLEALSKLESKWKSNSLMKSRQQVCQAYLEPTTKGHKKLCPASNALLLFFEDVGLLFKLDILDKTVIWERLSFIALNYWEILEPRVKELRAYQKDDTFYDKYEYMVRALCRMEARVTQNGGPRTDDQISEFAKHELDELFSTYTPNDDLEPEKGIGSRVLRNHSK